MVLLITQVDEGALLMPLLLLAIQMQKFIV